MCQAIEGAPVAPPFPAIVERHFQVVVTRCIPLSQPNTIDKDNPARISRVINPLATMAHRKKG